MTEPVNHRALEFKEAFLMVDKTDTGIIPKSELGKIVRALGYNPSEAEIAKVQVTVDPEGNPHHHRYQKNLVLDYLLFKYLQLMLMQRMC